MAEHICDGGAFGLVIGRRSGAVGVDIANIFWLQLRIPHRARNRPCGALFRRHHDIGGVRGHCEADHLRQNLGTPRLGVLIFFKDEDSGAFALDHPIARC